MVWYVEIFSGCQPSGGIGKTNGPPVNRQADKSGFIVIAACDMGDSGRYNDDRRNLYNVHDTCGTATYVLYLYAFILIAWAFLYLGTILTYFSRPIHHKKRRDHLRFISD